MDLKQKLKQQVAVFLEKQIQAAVFPGAAVALVWNGGDNQTIITAGTQSYASQTAVTATTLYDTASVTKSVITSTLALLLMEHGKIKLSDTVQSWQGTVNGKSPEHNLTIHHLLTHTVSFNLQLSQYKESSASEILDAVRFSDLQTNPGQSYAYVNAASVLLGLELERVSGASLAELAQKYIFNPLGMNQSYLGSVPDSKLSQIAPTEQDPWRGGEVRGQVHDESSWQLLQAPQPHFSGAAGLFTTAQDMATFMHAYLAGKLVSAQTLRNCATDQRPFFDLSGLSSPIGLGWELNQARWMGRQVSTQTIGKTGFTGCCIGMDLQAGFGVTLLCNHIYPKRPQDREVINATRRQLFDLVAELV